MFDTDNQPSEYRILIFLLLVAAAVLAIGEFVYYVGGSSGLNVLNIAVSSVLTAALVILYFRQTTILESQRNLRTQELNRDARQQHTETLRERVRLWHGNPDKETPDDPLDPTGQNLPMVKGASFESAPQGAFIPSQSDDAFQVIPHQLQSDRYLNDLLENHATDLKQVKDNIEQLHQRFDSLRTEFIESFDEGVVHETEQFTLEPERFLARWMFEFLVMLERGRLESFQDLREKAQGELARGDTGISPDSTTIWIRADIGGQKQQAVYSAVFPTNDRDELREWEAKCEHDTEQILGQVLDRVEDVVPYRRTVEAAKVLDDAQEAIHELEHLLIEYDGRPIYSGDCKYLDEARIEVD